jgi:hypothetical protein
VASGGHLRLRGGWCGPGRSSLVSCTTGCLARLGAMLGSDGRRAPVERYPALIRCDGNPIGFPLAVHLKPGATTGLETKKGAFAAVDDRFAEVLGKGGEVTPTRPGGVLCVMFCLPPRSRSSSWLTSAWG